MGRFDLDLSILRNLGCAAAVARTADISSRVLVNARIAASIARAKELAASITQEHTTSVKITRESVMTGSQATITGQLDNATQQVIDFAGTTYSIDGAIAPNTSNSTWRVVRNLTLEASGGDYAAIDLARWSGAYKDRIFENISITRTDQVGTGVIVKPTGVTWRNLQVKGCDIGLKGIGMNLNRFEACTFTGNDKGIVLDYDSAVGSGGVGNDNVFVGCHIRANDEIGLETLGNSVTPGKSAGNNNQFFGCCFEGSTGAYLMKLLNGYYNQFHGCRFEGGNGVDLAISAGGTLQSTKFIGSLFANAVAVGSGVDHTVFLGCDGSAGVITDNGSNTIIRSCLNNADNVGYGAIYDASATPTYDPPTTWTSAAKIPFTANLTAAANLFEAGAAGELVYVGNSSAKFLIIANVSLKTSAASNCAARLAINGTNSSNTQGQAYMVTTGVPYNIQCVGMMTLAPDDIVSVHAVTGSGTPTYTVASAQLAAHQL